MTRSDAAWAAVPFVLGAIDLWCESRDIKARRTHLTGTTASCSIRRGVNAVPYGAGPILFAAGLAGLRAWLDPHIVRHLDNKPAEL